MSRPRNKNERMIIADADGSLLFWRSGRFWGDSPVLVHEAELAARVHQEIGLTAAGPIVLADDISEVGAAAALLAALPGRVVILEAPQSVLGLYPEREDENEDELVLSGAVLQLQDGLVTERIA